jgi:hypothetical protein
MVNMAKPIIYEFGVCLKKKKNRTKTIFFLVLIEIPLIVSLFFLLLLFIPAFTKITCITNRFSARFRLALVLYQYAITLWH